MICFDTIMQMIPRLVYLSCKKKPDSFSKKLEACLADISTRMGANMLKLNQEKTELIIFNTEHKKRMTLSISSSRQMRRLSA